MSAMFTATLHPGVALGFLVLGASLHDVLTRLKAEPQRFPKLDLVYSPNQPVTEPVILSLPANGLRLRFDGAEQRLRLIEVIDFTLSRITYGHPEKDIVKPASLPGQGITSPKLGAESSSGPSFRNIYHRLMGPTYAGEYIPPSDDDKSNTGTYILSYPGVAFSFPLPESAYSPDKDVVSLLSAPASQTAISMAVFSGKSWAEAREILWTDILPSVKSAYVFSKSKDIVPDEISLVKIHGGGRLQLFKKWTSASLWIILGETTPQELVAELGPPDAIYRKNDQKMYIHKTRTASHSRSRSNNGDYKRPDDLTDTDQSSANTGSDDTDEEAVEDEFVGNVSGECFYNYFYLGFDILVSPPVLASRLPPSQISTTNRNPSEKPIKVDSTNRLVATKLVLHGNVPGSYPFNRHRRCRWEISYPSSGSDAVDNSETQFNELEERLREEWKNIYMSEDDANKRQRGMVLNRGWGDSPGSSYEFTGGWEDSSGGVAAKKFDGNEESTTTLYGFPGLVFEVLKNGYVSAVTVF
ncbi:uncharacterized protein BCR38DRAFT_453252 [Pseudomassariella vexata]|uniref:Uncharacterized protein n=1 Tax=Pseudomassariella vexata TaxID=1141098 RepID=A0A1Y2D712_9PEZI|nr:uncharacterized protein BCR38DRAFT_453252 [Pseudomassariella vexata]ORY54856.1 hypothetical protein BCR38DRAFT_453252 [Pseudomassariella vexata]